MAENDGNGKIKKVMVYITSDGSEFLNEEDAQTYQEKQDRENKEAERFNDGKKRMLVSSKNYTSINPSYAAVSGDFFERGGVYNSLESMVIDTPDVTNKLLLSITSR